MVEPSKFLSEWFAENCDDDWEHQYGVKIETLDNPGWYLSVDLAETELEGVVLEHRASENGAEDWIHWKSDGHKFEVYCDPYKLPQAIELFRGFLTTAREGGLGPRSAEEATRKGRGA